MTSTPTASAADPAAAVGTADAANRRLFVLVDDTEVSHSMWAWAQTHSIRPGDHVTLVTVAIVHPPMIVAPHGPAVMSALADATVAMERQATEEAKQKALEVVERLKEQSSPNGWTLDMTVVTAKAMGVGEAIVEFLKTHQEADEAIIGSRQMGGFKKAMMTMVGHGSVSDYVVHNAPCTVVVVHPPKQEGAASTEASTGSPAEAAATA